MPAVATRGAGTGCAGFEDGDVLACLFYEMVGCGDAGISGSNDLDIGVRGELVC
jgi:hypothetical protein